MIDTDFHTHVLPGMDDGSANVETSLSMLSMLCEQGIKTVAATPHFYAKKESIEDFLRRREASYKKLEDALEGRECPRIVLGAEVALTEGISKMDLRSLCYDGTDRILIEFPRMPYAEWMCSEIEIIAYEQELVPVIAHIDRYMEWYPKQDIKALLSFEECIFQINNGAFKNRKTRSAVKSIIAEGYPVILGSDAHDIESRRPNFDIANRFLQRIGNRKKILPPVEAACKEMAI